MEINLIGEALKFMVLGMGVVYLFLYIMVVAVKLQTKLIGKYFPEEAAAETSISEKTTDDDESARVAAVIAAVSEFRKSNTSKVSNG